MLQIAPTADDSSAAITDSSRLRTFVSICLMHFAVLMLAWLVLPASVQSMRSNDFRNRSEPVARNLLNGQGLREANGDLLTRYPPGHPLYLYTVFRFSQLTGISEPVALALFAMSLQALTGGILFLLATETWSAKAGLIVSTVWLFYPLPFYLSLQGNNEILFTPIFLLMCWVFWRAAQSDRRRLFFVSGTLLGAAMLIRPFIIGLPIFLGLLSLTRFVRTPFKRRVGAVAMLAVGTLLAILPWQMWTYSQTKRVYLVSSVGVYGVLDGLTYGIPRPRRLPMDLPADVAELQATALAGWQEKRITDFGSLLTWFRREALTRPRALASMIARKSVRVWYGTDTHRLEMRLLLFQAPYLIAMFVGGFLCLLGREVERRMAALGTVLVAFYWLMTMAGLSILRYMVPVMPLVLVLATPVVERVLQRLSSSGIAPSDGAVSERPDVAA